jgi:phosphatidylglycerol:prolipoprotein diacylglycerol transferase
VHLLAFEFPNFDKYVLGLQWHGFGVRWYALAYVAGILLGWWYAIRLARKDALWGPRAPVMSRDQIDDLILWITVGVIVGGRIGSMVFYNTSALWQTPLEIFKIWKGGMSFHGGLIGVMIAMLVFARMQRLPVLRVSDLVAPCVPIGLFFGRIANFINGELWGRHTNMPWGFYINDEDALPVHPSQLYEALLEGVVLFLILRLATHRFGQLKRSGAVTGIFLAGYGLFRILVEFVRAPDQGLDNLPLGLTMGMILSLPMLIAGVYLFMKAGKEPEVIAAPAPKADAAPKAAAKAPAKPKTASARAKAKPKA